MNYQSQRFYAVSETGSCSPDYQRWEEAENCGHAHKTIEAAEKCLSKKQRWYCQHGHIAGTLCSQCLGYAQGNSTSAAWYNGSIHNQHGERINEL